MKKITKFLFLISCLSILLLSACASAKLPKWADKTLLTRKSQELIEALNQSDLDRLVKLYNHPDVTAATFEESKKLVETLGAFKGYGTAAFSSGKTDAGQEFVRVIQTADYDEGKLTFTASFFEDGSVAGFFAKK